MARAGVSLREIDLSTKGSVQVLPSGTPAGVIGTAKKGPAFVPHVFANMQQFGDKFGSVTENSLLSNGHRFGPLAINEWMKNSQAGAFVRLLGVGDGTKAGSGGRASGAGFVVGAEQVQENGKVGRSSKVLAPEVTFADNGGGRAYMLGCYMSESNGSNYLSEAGLQSKTPQPIIAATLADAIQLTGIPNADDEIEITIPNTYGGDFAGAGGTISIIFKSDPIGAAGANEIFVKRGADTADTATNLRSAINGINDATIASYGAGMKSAIDPTNGIDSLTATGVGGNVTLTADILGAIGNSIELKEVTDATGAIALAGGEATDNLAGGASGRGAAPIIRGILFAANGVYPGIQVEDANTKHVGGGPFNDGDVADATTLAASAHGQFGENKDKGYNFGSVSTSQDFSIYFNGLDSKENSSFVKCSFDPNKTNYFAKVLNTDPTKIDETGHYLYSYWDIIGSAVPNNLDLGLDSAHNNSTMIGFLLSGSEGRANASADVPDYETFEDRYKTAKSPWVISQAFGGRDDDRTGLKSDGIFNLFKLHALDDGAIGQKQFRVLIENILAADNDDSYGQFDLILESLESDPIKGDKLAVFRNLSLDPESRNYIAKVIGDRHMYYDFDREEGKQRLEERGLFEVRNSFVRVELSEDLELQNGVVPKKAIPAGFRGLGHLYTKGAQADAIFSDDLGFWNGGLHFLSASIPPVPMVRSIGRFVDATSTEPDRIPWGVKFGLKKNVDADLKEVTETTFDRSIYSFLKFYSPSAATDSKQAMYVDQDDDFCNNLFSLEKISLKSVNATNNRIDNWGDAVYKRDGIKETSHSRFLVMETDAKTYNMKYLRFRFPMQGGFDGLNIFDKEKTNLTNAAAIRENNDETGTLVFTGPTIVAYQKGIDVFSDKSATEIQLLATPGVSADRVTDYGISACEDRFDAMYIMDIDRYNADSVISGSANTFENRVNVAKTVREFDKRELDTSFAAAYFPNVIIRRPIDNAPVKVPASVGVLGVYSQNDSIADPWFAPAGLERGRIQSAIGSDLYLREDELDEIYDVDINPIYVPAGRSEETYIFGQKTLLADPSALDRVNVRRLLISLRRQVKKVAEQLLFEPNRESTLARFSALVEPIMQRVQQRRGVVRYKVQIDTSTTTQVDVENNTLRGRIFLQPTKSVEFVSLDFVVTNTISE